jgi:hypothetical protein
MFSSSSSQVSNLAASPEEYYKLALAQSAELSKRLESLVAISRNVLMSQEQRMALESEYNMKKCILGTLNQRIQELTKEYPHLLMPAMSSGPVTGDHYNPSVPNASSPSSFSYASAHQLTTFHPGVNSQASGKHEKQHPRSRVTRGR